MKSYKFVFDVKSLSNEVCLTEKDTINSFRDGRVVSRFSEHWAEALYKFKKSKSSNQPGYDGTIKAGGFEKLRISIKSLTKSGIKFQQSVNQGAGRKCNNDLLLESLDQFDYVVVIDVIDFPIVKTIPIKVEYLKKLVKTDQLTCGGLKRNNLLKLIPELNLLKLVKISIDNLRKKINKKSMNTGDIK